MPEPTRANLRLCPTRVDATHVLFAHKVTQAQCQDRQRCGYHKCFTCVFNNALAPRHAPAVSAPKDADAASRARVG